jgi:hypothetical protein
LGKLNEKDYETVNGFKKLIGNQSDKGKNMKPNNEEEIR